MAETLTFDNTTEQTSADTLTSEEQDSLQVGEQIQEQENQLLAGKYENAQELEKAYIELQKKMGSDDKEEGEEVSKETEEESPKVDLEVTPAVEALTTAALEFEKSGQLTPETMEKFKEMSSSEIVDTYTKMYAEALNQGYSPDGSNTAPADITDAQVNSIHNSVGGEKAYDNMLSWATDNLPKAKMDSFDKLVDTGNIEAIQLAVDGLKSQYDNANGYEGRMLTGKAPQTSGDIFRSQAEVVKAMSHPDYDNDPAYRQDVVDKLARSDVDF